MAAKTERTFIAVKPDGVQRGLMGEIIKRFEQKGFRLVAMKFLQVGWSGLYRRICADVNVVLMVLVVLVHRRLRICWSSITSTWRTGPSTPDWSSTWAPGRFWPWWVLVRPLVHALLWCGLMFNRRDVVLSGMGGSECGEDRKGDARRDQSRRLQTRNHPGRFLHRSGQVRASFWSRVLNLLSLVSSEDKRRVFVFSGTSSTAATPWTAPIKRSACGSSRRSWCASRAARWTGSTNKHHAISAPLAGPVICRGLEFVCHFWSTCLNKTWNLFCCKSHFNILKSSESPN